NRVQVKVTQEDITALRAGVRQAEAALTLAQTALQDTLITAPLPGKVAHCEVEVGEVIAPGIPLLHLVNDEVVFFKALVPEKDVSDIRLGQTVEVTVDALPGETFSGAVVELLPTGDLRSRTFLAKISLDNPAGRLREGMFARGSIIVERRLGAVLVPVDAVLRRGEQDTVAVAVNGQATIRPVSLGLSRDGWIEITAGIEPGEAVIVEGSSQVEEGTPIRILRGTGVDV
ncbi:MAG TPA: efflux RND transporter periplasmic adaptor subunit, partial [Armatimonadetes bacterium]|nr:efflux RND transporter periplasmic adaptor subunit [Armatimonadota bacterium]